MSARTAGPKILLTGKNGQVGWELARALGPLGRVTAVDVDEVDFTNLVAVRELVRGLRPELIVNPAAYTAVDRAESEPDLAQAINGDAPGALAEEADRLGAAIVHFSTDYVFDGTKGEPYIEDDPPNPTCAYGRSKLAGERAVIGSSERHVILRLAWVYGIRGGNFLMTMLRLAGERDTVRVVDDQIGSPSWSRMIAAATAALCHGLFHGVEIPAGIYHLPAGGTTSWHGFAAAIFELCAGRLIERAPRLEPIATSEYPTAAARPPYSVLSGEKLRAAAGIALPDWRYQLEQAVADAAELRGAPR